jgi:flavin reductase (DIM6/NTAB) family NADH-FMN oxidoreductase RutF
MDLSTRKKTLRMFTNGMYVMTSHSGDQYGASTVSWISQASFKPALVMAAVRRDSNLYRCLSESCIAAIHILGSDQQDIAQKFFSPTQVCGRMLNGEPFSENNGNAPTLDNLAAYVQCRVVEILDHLGDHSLVVMEVTEVTCRKLVPPLTIRESPWEYGG